MRISLRFALAAALLPATLSAQQWLNTEPNPKTNKSTFRALEEWPTPNDFRDASGSPGPRYWQQRVDYVIKVALDSTKHALTGSERVTYHNNSPQALSYLWFQLDQNIESKDSRANMTKAPLPAQMSPAARNSLFPTPMCIHLSSCCLMPLVRRAPCGALVIPAITASNIIGPPWPMNCD